MKMLLGVLQFFLLPRIPCKQTKVFVGSVVADELLNVSNARVPAYRGLERPHVRLLMVIPVRFIINAGKFCTYGPKVFRERNKPIQDLTNKKLLIRLTRLLLPYK